jgi:predicted dehydrogenase
MSRPIDRRAFINRATGATAAVSMSLAGPLTRNVLGANDRVRVGSIGTGRQALSNMKAFQKHGAEVVAVCDVYEPNLAKGKAQAGEAAVAHKDWRRVLDDKTIDMVIVATPDHWHALPTVTACEAGKDVFVEKPVAVAVEEGKAMVGIGNAPDSDPPAGLDWDMWLGPAPKVPFNANRFGVRDDRWSTFRYFWDYSNGILGDWGVHHLDVVQWAMNTPGPRTITCVGQKLALQDNGDAPDTQTATFEYPEFVCNYEYRAANANSMFGKSYGLLFHGSEATMLVNRQGFEVFPETRKGKDDKDVARSAAMKMDEVDNGLENHAANMLECMRTRKRPACDIEDGLRSSAPCLLGVVALRTGERLEYDAAKLELKGASGAAKKLFGRDYRSPWKLA